MRLVVSLSFALLLLSIPLAAMAQQPAKASTASADEHSKSDATKKTEIVQLELWVLRLSPEADAHAIEQASLPLKDRKAVLARVSELEELGLIAHSQYLMASTIDDERLRLNLAAREPRIVGTAMTRTGRTSNIQYDAIGTLLDARPSIKSPSLVTCDLTYEESYMQPTEVALLEDEEGLQGKVDRIRTFVHQGTVGCPNGGATVLMASGGNEATDQPAMLIFLACRVME
ncbi:hypothetical protein NG895_06310 [Aeoliella sp. ICT_H6.2]|uniref:Uncharacterized protein n=1 Tax=Aeoliella straminimaris TaxID=2954799 RepID=A0A9X2F785_9BACT|nr:hypothetical protein [Aeoliella straminimaris]MCO6043515.1 hypothetical protein [Aeoliella straminimaris]